MLLVAPNGLLSPYYLAGYVHRYTYLKTSSDDEEDSEKEETPLSFAFAFTKAVTESTDYSFGSILPYAPDGGEITLKDGSKHTISLLFQFEDGLFAKFWQKYDAVLRHSFNQVDTNTLLPVPVYPQEANRKGRPEACTGRKGGILGRLLPLSLDVCCVRLPCIEYDI